ARPSTIDRYIDEEPIETSCLRFSATTRMTSAGIVVLPATQSRPHGKQVGIEPTHLEAQLLAAFRRHEQVFAGRKAFQVGEGFSYRVLGCNQTHLVRRERGAAASAQVDERRRRIPVLHCGMLSQYVFRCGS